MSTQVKSFILKSDKEIICKADLPADADYIIMEKPYIIQPVQNGPDSYGLGLFPYRMSNPTGTFRLYKDSIESEVVNIPDDIEKSYIKQTSGISIVSSLK